MKYANRKAGVLALAVAATMMGSGAAQAEDVLFWSKQAAPPEEAQAMRDKVLSGFEGEADFQGSDPGPWLTRIQAEIAAESGKIGVLGALHGDYTSISD